MRPSFPHPPIVRLRPRPDHDEPKAVVGRHGPRQPHTDATFAAVRRLIEQTTLNYQQIAARTGVSTGCISLLEARRGMEAAAVCAALERHDADRARERASQTAHARRAP